jgi:hypothetical protein
VLEIPRVLFASWKHAPWARSLLQPQPALLVLAEQHQASKLS